jgi:hypothetical protein
LGVSREGIGCPPTPNTVSLGRRRHVPLQPCKDPIVDRQIKSRLATLALGILLFNHAIASTSSCFAGPGPGGTQQEGLLLSIAFYYNTATSPEGHHLGFEGFAGISQDRQNIEHIAGLFFHGGAHYHDYGQEFSQPHSDNPPADTTELMFERKQKFLANLKSNLGDKSSERKMVIVTGHGAACLDRATKVQHWCLVLPMLVDMAQIEHSGRTLLFSTTDPWVVSDEELYESTRAGYYLIDSCHADLMMPMFRRLIGSGNHIVVLASGAGDTAAATMPWGGQLLTEVAGLLRVMRESSKTDPSSLSMLDWRGNGEMSFREALAIMQVNILNSKHFAQPTMPIAKYFDSPSAQAGYFSKENKDTISREFVSGIVDDTCFQRLNTGPPPPLYPLPPVSPPWLQLSKLINAPDSVRFLMSLNELISLKDGARTDMRASDFTQAQAQATFGYLKEWVGNQHAKEFACSIQVATGACPEGQVAAAAKL